MRPFAVFILVLATAIVTPAAVGPAVDTPRTIDIIGTDDMKYSVTTITAKRGERIQVRLQVRGKIPKVAMAHNFVLLKLGTDIAKLVAEGAQHRATDFIPPNFMSSVIAKTPLAGAGETVQVTFTAPSKPGKYPYICTFAGHYQSGMKGTLVVK